MSGRVQGIAWRANINAPNASFKMVLVRLADDANDQGDNSFPSNETVAANCQLSISTVKRAKKWLLENTFLSVDLRPNRLRGRTVRYRINVEALMAVTEPKQSKDDFATVSRRKPMCHEVAHGAPSPRAINGSQWRERGSSKRGTGSSDEPLPYTHLNTPCGASTVKAHHQASARPDGRLLGVQAGADTKLRLTEELLSELDVDLNGTNPAEWLQLVSSINQGLDRDAAIAYLSKRAGTMLAEGRIIIAVGDFRRGKILEVFGGLLKEFGWRVEAAKS